MFMKSPVFTDDSPAKAYERAFPYSGCALGRDGKGKLRGTNPDMVELRDRENLGFQLAGVRRER
jgi:hypothetical protein